MYTHFKLYLGAQYVARGYLDDNAQAVWYRPTSDQTVLHAFDKHFQRIQNAAETGLESTTILDLRPGGTLCKWRFEEDLDPTVPSPIEQHTIDNMLEVNTDADFVSTFRPHRHDPTRVYSINWKRYNIVKRSGKGIDRRTIWVNATYTVVDTLMALDPNDYVSVTRGDHE